MPDQKGFLFYKHRSFSTEHLFNNPPTLEKNNKKSQYYSALISMHLSTAFEIIMKTTLSVVLKI